MKMENQKAEKFIIKQKLKLEDCKNCLDANQLEKEINQVEKNKFDTDSLRENLKEFIKNDKLILKLQQRLKSKKHNAFIDEVKKLVLSANNKKLYNQ